MRKIILIFLMLFIFCFFAHSRGRIYASLTEPVGESAADSGVNAKLLSYYYFTPLEIEKSKLLSLLTGQALPDRLKEHYDTLREKYFYEYAAHKKYGGLRYFVASVLHDAEELKWNECDLYEEKYGEKCNHISRETLCSILNYIFANYPGCNRAEQIYNYMASGVHYRGERGEYPRFPLETLYYRHGDCEDQAIATAALLKLAGYTTAMYVIHDPKFDIDHCVCVCKVPDNIKGKKWRIKEYYDWGHCWFMLDPTYKYRFGDNPSWVDNYLQKSGYLVIPDEAANCLMVDFDTYKEFCKKADG